MRKGNCFVYQKGKKKTCLKLIAVFQVPGVKLICRKDSVSGEATVNL